MPRQARLVLENVCYHVIARGNQKNSVFRDEEDYRHCLTLLARYKTRFEAKIYGWCLMNNHMHIVAESNKLSRFMHGLNLSYAQYFRYKYKTIGHFWQDRFKSYVIQKDRYLLNCITYIEYNPVRAKIVLRPEDYEWSSYNIRVLGRDGNDLLDVFAL